MNTILKSVYAAGMLFICACGTPAVITSSWHKPDVKPDNYNNIFIAAVTSQISDKQMIEDDVQRILQQKGLTVEKSMDLFPPKFIGLQMQHQEVAISTIKPTGAEGILTIQLIQKDKESRFVPLAPWEPNGDDYYNSHLNMFANGSPYVFEFDGFYKDHIVYFVEANFYDTKSGQLIWTAQSKTYDPNDINGFVKGYVDTIFNRMVKDGVMIAANKH